MTDLCRGRGGGPHGRLWLKWSECLRTRQMLLVVIKDLSPEEEEGEKKAKELNRHQCKVRLQRQAALQTCDSCPTRDGEHRTERKKTSWKSISKMAPRWVPNADSGPWLQSQWPAEALRDDTGCKAIQKTTFTARSHRPTEQIPDPSWLRVARAYAPRPDDDGGTAAQPCGRHPRTRPGVQN
ncbi:hypothetical protein HPB49_008367 [Dermacentor silvarum]|uniref:Uncharacterized protein n=1 Tax=Dermacentor silvarum TaxID=543639 RepID=A0ACB8DBV8_DERSI|nr:hypothetical protein HPB49_008367 [Dermacentor silvarum]